MLLELVTKLSTYEQFGRPLMNYLESTSLNNETKEYIEILKLYWDINYDEVIERIEKDISKLRKGSLYYENNPVNKGFILMANAREKKNEEEFKKNPCKKVHERFKILLLNLFSYQEVCFGLNM